LQPYDFHDDMSSGQDKYVLCAFESNYICDDGDLALPGKCLIRSPQRVTWNEAAKFCRGKGASSITIHNEAENAGVTGILQRDEAGWLLPA
ncbi:hypothetical protein PENTCL1PPCAC_4138, partial [Pristionchus entomophagus]